MGMFNYVYCEFEQGNQKFDINEECQTKDLGESNMDRYTIRKNGEVWVVRSYWDREEQSEPEQILNLADIVENYCPVIPPHFEFYWSKDSKRYEYIAIVKDNKVYTIEELPIFYDHINSLQEYKDWIHERDLKDAQKEEEYKQLWFARNPGKTQADYKYEHSYIVMKLKEKSFVEQIMFEELK